MILPFTLRTLSPLHIGNGFKFYRDIDFFSKGERIYVVDDTKLYDKLGEENFKIYLQYLEGEGDVVEYFRNYSAEDWKAISSRSIVSMGNLAGDELSAFIHDGMGKVYIPGSGIKGTLTTLLTGYILKGEELRLDEIMNGDKGILNKTIGDGFRIESFAKYLQVSDMHFDNPPQTEYYALKVLNQERVGRDIEWRYKQNTQMGLEVLPTGSVASGRIKVDALKLDKVPSVRQSAWFKKLFATGTRIEDSREFVLPILKAWKKQSLSILQSEVDFWDDDEVSHVKGFEDFKDFLGEKLEQAKQCKENEMVIRIGSGQGHKSITGGILAQAYANDAIEVNDYVMLVNRLRRREYNGSIYFPKTRKMNDHGAPLGFVKLSFDV